MIWMSALDQTPFCSNVLLPTITSIATIQFPCTEGCSNAITSIRPSSAATTSIRRTSPAYPISEPKGQD